LAWAKLSNGSSASTPDRSVRKICHPGNNGFAGPEHEILEIGTE
jgi:hypothetical protein